MYTVTMNAPAWFAVVLLVFFGACWIAHLIKIIIQGAILGWKASWKRG